jgi:hypothetical protein
MFKKGKVLIHPEGAIPDTTMNIGVREGKLYRLQGKPVCRSKGILDLIHSDVNGSMSVAEDEEKKAPKGEQSSETSSSGSQPSGGEEELAPSSSVRRPSWYELTLRDAQEKVEAPRSTFRESRPPKKFPNFMVLMSSIIDSKSSSVQEATDQQVWRDSMGQDDV